MSFLAKQPDSISNYFDGLCRGIGHRGSSFTDIDAATHDGAVDRFLIQEFKTANELEISRGQMRLLEALAQHGARFTVWYLKVYEDSCGRPDYLRLWDIASGQKALITPAEYQRRYGCWWDRRPVFK